jgi:hypothetical protein
MRELVCVCVRACVCVYVYVYGILFNGYEAKRAQYPLSRRLGVLQSRVSHFGEVKVFYLRGNRTALFTYTPQSILFP